MEEMKQLPKTAQRIPSMRKAPRAGVVATLLGSVAVGIYLYTIQSIRRDDFLVRHYLSLCLSRRLRLWCV